MDGACGGSNGHLTAIRHRSGRSTGGVGYYVEGGAFYDAPNDPDEQKLTAELKFAKKTATVMTYEQYFRREKVCTACTAPLQKPEGARPHDPPDAARPVPTS